MFHIVPPSPLRANEVRFSDLSQFPFRALYSLNLNLPVQANDFIGFSAFISSSLVFGVSMVPVNAYYRDTLNFKSVFELENAIVQTVVPLMTAVVSRKCVYRYNIIRSQLATAESLNEGYVRASHY